MQTSQDAGGSATRWGPLFGAHADDWAQTWEGPAGWGTPVYEHVLDHAGVTEGTWVLDCGCGAGRFARMAADAGAEVAGIDAAAELVDIARRRVPEADLRVGDLEALPWPDRTFDVVTGFSAFQFADDKVGSLVEARRVSRGVVAAVIPTRVSEAGLAAVFKPLLGLFPPDALASMQDSGMFGLSEPGRLDEVLAAAGLAVRDDREIEWSVAFDDRDTAVRAFVGAGPMQLAIRNVGEQAVTHAVADALDPFADLGGHVALPAWYRVVLAEAEAHPDRMAPRRRT